MASTRNKNTSINYNIQQKENFRLNNYTTYKAYGESYNTTLSGNGLNPGKLPSNILSNNCYDIESFLFGINSTNLVNPTTSFTPELNSLNQTHIFNKDDILMPKDLVIQNNQRPHFK